MIHVALALDTETKAGPMLFVSADAASNAVRLSRVDPGAPGSATLWRRWLPMDGESLRDARRVDGRRIALLLGNPDGTRAEVKTIDGGDGGVLRSQSVDPTASGLASVGSQLAVITPEGLLPLRPPDGSRSGEGSAATGSLERHGVVYVFSMTAARDLSSGYFAAYRAAGNRFDRTYYDDVVPGPSTFALCGDRLLLLRSGDDLQVYNVSVSAHPRLGGRYRRHEDWIAFATAPQKNRFYGLGRSGFLQAYSFDDRTGIVPISAPAAVRPDGEKLVAEEGAVAVCGSDGTVQLFTVTDRSLTPAGEFTVGNGKVWPVGLPVLPRTDS